MVIMRIHRDTYPRTDHGHTWVERIWFEKDGKRISPLIPSAGCCEQRLMCHPPQNYKPNNPSALRRKSATTHTSESFD